MQATTVELNVNMYRESVDYGKPFGFSIVRGNRVLKRYLLHDWQMVYFWRMPERTRQWLKAVATKEESKG
jgi:hypothetical protein